MKRGIWLFAWLLALGCCWVPAARAATWTWNAPIGYTGAWNDVNMWSGSAGYPSGNTAQAILVSSTNGGAGAATLNGATYTINQLRYQNNAFFNFRLLGGGGTLGLAGTSPLVQVANAGGYYFRLVDGSLQLGATTTFNTTATDDGFMEESTAKITGSGGLTKTGPGVLILSGANTYGGATQVSAGLYVMDGASTSTSPVTVAASGTLAGTGTINNTVTVAAGGIVHPGAYNASSHVLGTGTLSTRKLSIAGIFDERISGSAYGQIKVTGNVALSGTLNVSVDTAPAAGSVITLIDNDIADAVSGTFSGLPQGGTFTAGGSAFKISYTGGDGNDVTLTVLPPPTISGISPNQGPTLGGQAVTITGTNLANATSVTFGGTSATITSDTATQIVVTTPAHAAGAATVTVTTANGSANGSYTYIAAPTVTSISPTQGPTAGGTITVITGTNFTGATAVTFGGTAATSFTVNSATQITATAPAHAAGAVTVAVTTPGGTGSKANAYTYIAAPTVTSVSPTQGPTAGGTSTVITGTNFTGATAVTFGGTAATSFTVNSATQITATAPAHAAGAATVAVTTAGGTGSKANAFTYIAAPTVTSVSPTQGPVAGGTSIVITGTNFTGATAVTFGGTAATSFTVNSATQITATAPAHTAGAVAVAVTTVGGTGNKAAAYTYIAAPTVTSVSPAQGPIAGATSVVITGTNFSGATAVTFGGTAATSYTVNSATQITATAPAHAAGAVTVAVTTAGGTGSSTNAYTYIAAPTVTSVSPNQGPATGATSVVITGTGFTGVTAVMFGGTAATAFTANSATQITATAPAHALGTVDITVTTPGGSSATGAADQYTYIAAPTVTAVWPNQGAAAGGTTVTITGTGFSGATGVNFGATAATSYVVDNATQITATAPGHAAGTVDITVTTPAGTSATGVADQYTYTAVPTVTSVLAGSGQSTGGATVTIGGASFTGVTAVTFGATAAGAFTFVDDGHIIATAPAGTGTVDVTVTTPDGTSATNPADQYTYFVPSLVVNSLADGLPAMPINCAVGNASSCRLRDAVSAALNGDTITFAVDGTITLTANTTLTLAQSVGIDASGHAVTVDGNNAKTVFTVNAGVVASLDHLVIQHGNTSLDGGAIANHGTLTLADGSVLNNATTNGAGAGIYSDGDALTLVRVTVSDNYANGGGGEGAGVYSARGALVVSDSIVSDNAATHDSGGIYIAAGSARVVGTTISGNTTGNGAGGGIYNSGTLTAINSTIAGNVAGGGSGNGGGIYNSGGPYDSAVGTVTLINVTVAGNTSVQAGVEIYNWGTFTLTNSIIDRLIAGGVACGNGGAHALTDNGGNLDSDGTCGFSAANNSQSNAMLDLGALAPVNGSIPVMLPASDSDAIDFGLDSACADANTVAGVDERGATRPMGAHCDAGAVEVMQYSLSVNVSGNGSAASATPAIPATSSGITACSASAGTCSAFYPAGTQVALALTPAAGWRLDSVVVADGDCGGSLAAGASPYTTSALTGACTLNVTFAVDGIHFALSGTPAQTTAGSPFGFTVTALDAADNLLPSYTGTVHFTSSDAAADLPTDAALSGGTGTLQATLNTLGNQTITATDTAYASIAGTSASIHVTGVQTITFPPQAAQAYSSGGTFAINPLATTDGDSPIVYSSKTPAVCTVAGTTVTIVSAGTCTLAANTGPSASGDYVAATEATQSVAIGLAAQTITFPDPGAQTLTDGTFLVSASTDSGLQVTFATASSACSIGSPGFVTPTTTATVTMLAAGTCSITASQAGDANYTAATAVTRDVTIAKKSTTLTLSGPASVHPGDTLTITATVQGDPPSGTVLFCDGAFNGGSCTGTALCAPGVALVAGANSSSAMCTTSLATSGTHSITAYYGGDNVFLPIGAAQPLVVAVNAAPATASAVSAPFLDRWLLLTLAALVVAGAFVRRRFCRPD